MIHQYINQHITENNPNQKEVITIVNWMLFGRWVKCEFGRKREIVGTSQCRILTFAHSMVTDVKYFESNFKIKQNLLFDIILN